jgi:hypothetical protein
MGILPNIVIALAISNALPTIEVRPFPGKGDTYNLTMKVFADGKLLKVARYQIESNSSPEVVRDLLAVTFKRDCRIDVQKLGKASLCLPAGVRVEFISPDLNIDSLPKASLGAHPPKP